MPLAERKSSKNNLYSCQSPREFPLWNTGGISSLYLASSAPEEFRVWSPPSGLSGSSGSLRRRNIGAWSRKATAGPGGPPREDLPRPLGACLTVRRVSSTMRVFGRSSALTGAFTCEVGDGSSLRKMRKKNGFRSQRLARPQRDQPLLATQPAARPRPDTWGRNQAHPGLYPLPS